MEAKGKDAARKPKAILGTCCANHFLHDGFSDVLYVLLPVWQAEFALSLTQVGLAKSVFAGALAAAQVPMSLLAERRGERAIMAAGTALAGLAFIAMAPLSGFLALLPVLALAGLACGTQHPLASAMVSRAFEGGRQRPALGIYNFAGDLGKVAVPLAASLVIAALGWRWATTGYGLLGVVAAGAVFAFLGRLVAGDEAAVPESGAANRGWGILDGRGFATLGLIGAIDTAGRAGFMTFLPFLLIGKGAGVETVGVALALVFAGGALGKIACGFIAERLGIVRSVVLTELLTGGGILLLLPLPLVWAMVLLPLIGVGLNGTSSVLYGTLAEFIAPERRSRGFGLFYTMGLGAGAVAPALFGILSDAAGISITLACVAAFVLLTVPLALHMRRSLEAAA